MKVLTIENSIADILRIREKVEAFWEAEKANGCATTDNMHLRREFLDLRMTVDHILKELDDLRVDTLKHR